MSRTADWGWRMETDDAVYVAELSVDGPHKYGVLIEEVLNAGPGTP